MLVGGESLLIVEVGEKHLRTMALATTTEMVGIRGILEKQKTSLGIPDLEEVTILIMVEARMQM